MTVYELEWNRIHPLVVFLYLTVVIGVALFAMNPIITAIAFFGSFFFGLTWRKKREKNWTWGLVLFFLACAFLNPLFNHNGKTVVLFINQKAFTLEAVLYGLLMAGTLVTILLWSGHMTQILTGDKILYLIGRGSPKTALMISMIFRLVPEYKRQTVYFRENQKLLGLYGDNLMERFKGGMHVFFGMLTWALEHSMETADSIRARGYGTGRRTTYNLYHLQRRDLCLLLVLLVPITGLVYGLFHRTLNTVFYPSVVMPKQMPVTWLLYGAYVLVVLSLPAFIKIQVECKNGVKKHDMS